MWGQRWAQVKRLEEQWAFMGVSRVCRGDVAVEGGRGQERRPDQCGPLTVLQTWLLLPGVRAAAEGLRD